jgi:hypothetical protein
MSGVHGMASPGQVEASVVSQAGAGRRGSAARPAVSQRMRAYGAKPSKPNRDHTGLRNK